MSLEGNIESYTSEATSGQMPTISETPSSVERSSGEKNPEGSSRHMPMGLSEGTAIQQVLELQPMLNLDTCLPEWARELAELAELRSPGHFSQLSGNGRRIWPKGEDELFRVM